jgi:hypothetical protein
MTSTTRTINETPVLLRLRQSMPDAVLFNGNTFSPVADLKINAPYRDKTTILQTLRL